MEAKQLRSNLNRMALNFAHYKGCMFKTISGANLRACQKFDEVGASEKWTMERTEQIEFATEILRSCVSRLSEEMSEQGTDYDDPYEPALNFDDFESPQRRSRSESEPLDFERPRKKIRLPSAPDVVITNKQEKSKNKRRGDELETQNLKRQRIPRGRLTRNSQNAPILPKRVFGGQRLLSFLGDVAIKSSQAIISIDNRTKEAQLNAIAFYHDDPIKIGYARLIIYPLSEDIDTRHSAFVYYCISEIAKKVRKGSYRHRGIVFEGLLSEEFADLGAEQYNTDLVGVESRLKFTNVGIRNMVAFINNRLNDRFCPIESKTQKGTLCR